MEELNLYQQGCLVITAIISPLYGVYALRRDEISIRGIRYSRDQDTASFWLAVSLMFVIAGLAWLVILGLI
jgi:hypothetical protein